MTVDQWASKDPDVAVPMFVWQAVQKGEPGEGPKAAMARVGETLDALPVDARAAAVRDALSDEGGMMPDALLLAGRLCDERDAQRATEKAADDAARLADDGRRYGVCLVDGAVGNQFTSVMDVPWKLLAKVMTTPKRVESADKLRAPGWLPVRLNPDAPHERFDVNVASVSCLVLDIDDGADLDEVERTVAGFEMRAALHTTWSHKPDHHKARIVFPFAEDCPADRWLDTWAAAECWARSWGAHIDKTCKNTSRLYFQPALPAGEWAKRSAWFRGRTFTGSLLSWRWLQAYHMPPPEVFAVPPIMPKSSAGRSLDDVDREHRGRQKYARIVLDNRSRDIATATSGKGQRGRNAKCYTGARAAGQLIIGGWLDEGEAYAAMMAAAATSGLKAKEAHRAVTNGINKGKEDGPWVFSINS